jgi:hypothetical protein
MLRELLLTNRARPAIERLQVASLSRAAREQGLYSLIERLRSLVPDISSQYTTYAIDTAALEWRVRALHAFQITLALKAVDQILRTSGSSEPSAEPFTIADIGDSAGTHILYLNALLGTDRRFANRGFRSVSINLDPVAVTKIQSKGLPAILCAAENLHEHDMRADLFISFETLEHLRDPISFLDAVSSSSRCDWFALTVPYVRRSRVGMQYIRLRQKQPTTAENTHVFELSPADWRLIFLHSGWNVVDESIFLQYPRWSLLHVLRPFWGGFDFEGFYGVLLRRDRTWAELYKA